MLPKPKQPEAGAGQPQDKAPEQDLEQELEQELEQGQEQEEEFDKERALSTIRKQREAEEKLAKQLKEAKDALKSYQDKEKQLKEAELSELEKAQKRAEELEQSLKEAQTMTQALRLQQSFSSTASKLSMKFASEQAAEDAFELADLAEVEIDANGKVTGLEDALKALQKSRPYLFVANDNDPPGTPKRPKLPGNAGKDVRSSAPKISF